MIQIKRAIDTVLNKQYPCPRGVVGLFAGELMVRQHAKETAWTISVAEIQPTDQVLEIGFGAGKAIELLSQRTHSQVHGIDLSATMLNRARARNTQAVAAGRVTLLQGEAAQLPFGENQFDKVISIHTFYFWSDPLVILTEIFRVLKPGGKLIFTLATGKVGETKETERLQLIEEQVLPQMRSIGFIEVSSRQGPLARQFKILAVLGTKPFTS